MSQSFHSQVHFLKIKTYVHTEICIEMSRAALFIIPKSVNNPGEHQLMNGQNVTYICTTEHYSAMERKCGSFYNINKLKKKHCVK